MPRHEVHYLPEGGDRPDLADQLANSSFDDPWPRIWIAPLDADDQDEPNDQWTALWECDEDREDFSGTRDEAIAWARHRPAIGRFLWTGRDYVELDPLPGDAPAPPPPGPSVQVQGPDHDGRWVAVWYHRGEVKQFWGSRDDVVAWAVAQPAERRKISVDGHGWRLLEP